MKTLILVNALTSVSSFVYANHIAFATQTIRKRPDDKIDFFCPHRMTIDNARNVAAKMALESGCDYLFFLDDDVLVPPNALDLLINADKDIIAGLVYLRGYPFHTMIFKELESSNGKLSLGYYDDLLINDEVLQPCAAVGFSCALIKCDVLQAMEPPYFVTGPHNTEDVYFCMKSRELEPKPSIFVHTGVRCGHLLNPEPIEYATKQIHTTFCEEIQKISQLVSPVPNPRNLDYIQRNLKALGA